MKKELLKEDEDNLLDDLDKIDNEDKPEEKSIKKPEENNDEKPEEKNIVDLMVSGDIDAVKTQISKHVVSVVASSVNDINNDEEESTE
jgi:hypothetical protein